MSPSKERQRLLFRLGRMRWDELRTRVCQETNRQWDILLYYLGNRSSGDSIRSRDEARGRFFFDPGDLDLIIATLSERLPEEMGKLMEEAEQICQHRLDLLGFRDINYGPKIDWHLDPIHRRRAPRKPWFKIRYLAFEEVGDHKIIWELNRHQHLTTLAKAYCLTKEKRFGVEVLNQWYDWQRENPYPIGINWASSLEVAFRGLSWLWVRHLLTPFDILPDRFETDLLKALSVNGRHIERYISTYFSPNTHLLGEGVALFFIGLLCPELPHATRWRQRGWDIILRESQRQVQQDGMHFEQSIYYHVYALDFFLHARILAERNKIPVPFTLDQALEKMLEALRLVAQTGWPPRLGDDDGGRVFNPRRNRAEHMLDPLSTGAALYSRPDFKVTIGRICEETLWLLGAEGASRFDRLPLVEPSVASSCLESSGIHVMASSEPIAQQLVIDAGPQGVGSAGHGHADALSVHLSGGGRELVVDPGTFCYVSAGKERDLFRGTAAHNTLQVDGLDQAAPAGPFAWRSLPRVKVDHWSVGGSFDLFAGSQTGYCRLPNPVSHRRWVFHLKSRFWLIRDRAEGKGKHQLSVSWHLSPVFRPGFVLQEGIAFCVEGEQGLVFLPAQNHGWKRELTEGCISPVYGTTVRSLVLRFYTEDVLPAEFTTLLFLLAETDGRPDALGTFTSLVREPRRGPVCGYCYESQADDHYVFFAEPGQSWQLGRWESDAEFLYWSLRGNGVEHWILCDGSYVKRDGQLMVSAGRTVPWWEWMGQYQDQKVLRPDEPARGNLTEAVASGVKFVRSNAGLRNFNEETR